MSGQTLTDRIAAAQYQLTGSDMARGVCKATTHEVMAPKKKHLECKCPFSFSPLLHCIAFKTPCSIEGLNRPTPLMSPVHSSSTIQHGQKELHTDMHIIG